jgi:hypothetical protein
MYASVAFTLLVAAVNPEAPAGLGDAAAAAKQLLKQKHASEAARIDSGVDQAARYWRASDGDAAAFRAFVEGEFLPEGETREATFKRLEYTYERLYGYLTSLGRDLRTGLELDLGPILPIDQRLGAWDVGAHVSDDLFANKAAFVILLNFPLTTLEERLREGGRWTPRQWAEVRLAQSVSARVPAEVRAKSADAYAKADDYIASYNVYMHHLLTPTGERLFPAGQRLISHWNLRDDLKARYAEKDGLAKQRLIQLVMERIVRQEIPAAVVNNPRLDWEPKANTVKVSTVKDAEAPAGAVAEARAEREPDERYRRWQAVFAAESAADPYYPDNPSHMARRFNLNREIPEPEAKALLEAVLTSPVGTKVAKVIEGKLKRKLEPFDIWYAGFKPRAAYPEAELDAATKKKYPTVAAFAQDMPRILTDLGFTPERAKYLAERIEVDPSRGAGHAMGAARRDDKAHLRTRVGKDGMDYKGYNIAIHELGHNVEQTFSLQLVPSTLYQGVPNTAFTEALAFVFQTRDMELLGLSKPDAEQEHNRVLEAFWGTREIAGVGLLDIAAWRWLYEHPKASPAEFRAAVVSIAQDLWNRYYAPIFGVKDVPLLAIYSHLISNGLYTPDYPIGHLIEFQLEEHFAKVKGPMGPEFERICRQGAITPDAWMRGAVGGPLSAQPMLDATEKALAGSK